MSRAAKAFLASSILVTGLTVWGVHFIQAREEEVRRSHPTAIPSNPITPRRQCTKALSKTKPA